MSSWQTAPSWKDRRRLSVKAFYDDPLTKVSPVLPAGWHHYKDKEGFQYYADKKGHATFEHPPLPSKKTKVCKGVDLLRAYQSPGIIATNIFNTCKFRCGGDFGGGIPTIYLREP